MTKEERKDQILTAAAKVFFMNGFEGATMRLIAQTAGIGKGTLYEYFPSKEDLYEETVKNLRDTYTAKINEIIEHSGTFRKKFISFTKYQATFTKQYINILPEISKSKMMAREIGTIVLEMSAITEKVISKLLSQAVKNNEIRPDLNIEVVSSMVIGTINEYFIKKVILDGVPPESLHYEVVIDNLLSGIGIPEIQ